MAKDAFNLIFNNTIGKIEKISNEVILGDECLLQQMGGDRHCTYNKSEMERVNRGNISGTSDEYRKY